MALHLPFGPGHTADRPPAPATGSSPGRGEASTTIERAAVREILMGAQDNLTNVLAVMLGVSIGSGRAALVALAGAAAAVAEAVSMGGVLYSATRARDNQRRREAAADERAGLSPVLSGLTTFAAALLAGVVPLAPFAVAPMPVAVVASIAISLGALFALGSWTGRLIGETWWRDGLRLLAVAGAAAVAAAAVGTVMRVD